jgi:hypothetical protein
MTFNVTFVLHMAQSITEKKLTENNCNASTLATSPPSTFEPSSYNVQKGILTDDHLALLGEVVCGHFEVERRWALSYAARDIVVGTVAGAEPAAEVASLANGDTSKMGADT